MRSVAIPVFVVTHACVSESNKANGKSNFQLPLGSEAPCSEAPVIGPGGGVHVFFAPFIESCQTKKQSCKYRQQASFGADFHHESVTAI